MMEKGLGWVTQPCTKVSINITHIEIDHLCSVQEYETHWMKLLQRH